MIRDFIQFRVSPGESLEEAWFEAVRQCTYQKCQIRFDFNDKPYSCTPIMLKTLLIIQDEKRES